MCGRFLNKLPVAEIARIFGTRNALPNYPVRFNIAPTDPVLTVRFNPETKERSADVLLNSRSSRTTTPLTGPAREEEEAAVAAPPLTMARCISGADVAFRA
jgi:putative SOS response-associated peptidase YedK